MTPLDRRLDNRERLFVAEYIASRKPREAALAAGYAESTALSSAYEWVSNSEKKPHVYQAIQREINERLHGLGVTTERVQEEQARIAFSNLADYEVDGEGNITLTEGASPESLRAISSIHRKIKTYREGDREVQETDVKISLWNKNKALRDLGEQLGMHGPKGDRENPIHVHNTHNLGWASGPSD